MSTNGIGNHFLLLFCYLSLFLCFIKTVRCSSYPEYSYELEDEIGEGEEDDEIEPRVPLTIIHNTNNSVVVTLDLPSVNEEYPTKISTQNTGTGTFSEKSPIQKMDKFQSKLSKTGDYIFGSLLIGFGFISLVGNTSILIVFFFRHRRLSPAEVFLVNLGIVDILLAIASYPMSMMASFKHGWDFGEMGCTLYAFVCYFLGLASIFSVVAIAFIRYLKTCNPAVGNQITCWTSCKMIACGYFLAFIGAAFPLFGFGNYDVEPFGLSCTLDWVARDQASRGYIVCVTIFCVFVPLIIIAFCYTNIIILVKQSDALVRSNGVNKRNMKGSDLQLTWISALVAVGFVAGWFPYSVVSLWASYRGEVVLPMWATPIPVLLAKSSIAYNPFIYIFFTSRYRQDFINLLRPWIHSHAKGNRQNVSVTSAKVSKTVNNKETSGNSSSKQGTNTTSNGTANVTPVPQRSCKQQHHEANVVVNPIAENDNDYDEPCNLNNNDNYSQDENNLQQIILVRDALPSMHVVTMVSSTKGVVPVSTKEKLFHGTFLSVKNEAIV